MNPSHGRRLKGNSYEGLMERARRLGLLPFQYVRHFNGSWHDIDPVREPPTFETYEVRKFDLWIPGQD
jgi:hypothetical protein